MLHVAVNFSKKDQHFEKLSKQTSKNENVSSHLIIISPSSENLYLNVLLQKNFESQTESK